MKTVILQTLKELAGELELTPQGTINLLSVSDETIKEMYRIKLTRTPKFVRIISCDSHKRILFRKKYKIETLEYMLDRIREGNNIILTSNASNPTLDNISSPTIVKRARYANLTAKQLYRLLNSIYRLECHSLDTVNTLGFNYRFRNAYKSYQNTVIKSEIDGVQALELEHYITKYNSAIASEYQYKNGVVTCLSAYGYSTKIKAKKALRKEPKEVRKTPKKATSNISDSVLLSQLSLLPRVMSAKIETTSTKTVSDAETNVKELHRKSFYRLHNLHELNKKKATKREVNQVRYNSYQLFDYAYLNNTIYSDYLYYFKYLLLSAPNTNYRSFLDTYDLQVDDLLNVVLVKLLRKETIEKFKQLENPYFVEQIEKLEKYITNSDDYKEKSELQRTIYVFQNIIEKQKKAYLRDCLRASLEPYCRMISNIVTISRDDDRILKQIKKLQKTQLQTSLNQIVYNSEKNTDKKNKREKKKNKNFTPMLINTLELDKLYSSNASLYNDTINSISTASSKQLMKDNLDKTLVVFASGKLQKVKLKTILKQYRILNLKYNKSMNTKSICKQLGISKQAVGQAFKREYTKAQTQIEYILANSIEL